MNKKYVLGIDIGGTKIAAALVSDEGDVLKEIREPAGCKDFDSFLAPLDKVINEFIQYSAEMEYVISGIGLAVAGLIDFKKQMVLFSPNLPLQEASIGNILEEKFDIPVLIDNDANCAAWAEKLIGAGRGKNDFICVTIGTGIGGGIIADGKLYRGAIGCAGEIGHMVVDTGGPLCGCGRAGCFEALASAHALARKAACEAPDDSLIVKLVNGVRSEISGEIINEAARQGDVFARDLFAKIGRIIGSGIASLINILNPEIVVIGGGLAGASEFFLPAAREEIASQISVTGLHDTEVVLAQLGQRAGIIGAAFLARDELSLDQN